jgi:hypothetical protein
MQECGKPQPHKADPSASHTLAFLSTLKLFIPMKIYAILLFVILNSCMTSKIAFKTGIEEISFGNSGGFTGEVKTYKLTADCKLFEKETELKKVESKKTFELFTQAKELKDLNFNEPENMYSFIEIKTKEKTNKIVWAFGSTTVNKKVIALYNNLISTTK